jgi:hypothetical protein
MLTLPEKVEVIGRKEKGSITSISLPFIVIVCEALRSILIKGGVLSAFADSEIEQRRNKRKNLFKLK